jgi:hypothetical protein
MRHAHFIKQFSCTIKISQMTEDQIVRKCRT